MSSTRTVLAGDQLRLFRALERLFIGWAEQAGADEYRFPPTLPARELSKLDYFACFPHLVTFPVALSPEEKNVAEFAARKHGATVQLTELGPVEDVLTPAACYHFYVHLQGQRFDARRLLSTQATCFRREAEFVPMQRLWGFTMRELVCIGTRDEVKAFLADERQRLAGFFSELGLPITFEQATDPFFRPKQSSRYVAQLVEPVKHEMIYQGLSLGSLNFHLAHFGEAFELARSGAPAYSGCVAFGLERWVHAITHHFGASPAGWPSALMESHS